MNLFAIKDLDVTFGDSLVVLLLGMLIVMVVLALIIGMVKLIKLILDALEGGKKASEVSQAAPAVAVRSETIQEDEETVAAITAAVAIMLEDESKDGAHEITAPFVIKKIKRIR